MEKRDLEIRRDGKLFGAFEDVSNVVEDDNSITFDSKDGHCTFIKDEDDLYRSPDFPFSFDSYKIQVRRTTKSHFSGGDLKKARMDVSKYRQNESVEDTPISTETFEAIKDYAREKVEEGYSDEEVVSEIIDNFNLSSKNVYANEDGEIVVENIKVNKDKFEDYFIEGENDKDSVIVGLSFYLEELFDNKDKGSPSSYEEPKIHLELNSPQAIAEKFHWNQAKIYKASAVYTAVDDKGNFGKYATILYNSEVNPYDIVNTSDGSLVESGITDEKEMEKILYSGF